VRHNSLKKQIIIGFFKDVIYSAYFTGSAGVSLVRSLLLF